MDRKSYRPLMPAEAGGASFDFPKGLVEGLKRKENKARVACNPCRRRKTKCDSVEPVCSACSLQPNECVYAAPKAETSTARREDESIEMRLELLDLLRLIPGKGALELLHLWRIYGDAAQVLSVAQQWSGNWHFLSGGQSPKLSSFQAELTLISPASYPMPWPLPPAAAGEYNLFGSAGASDAATESVSYLANHSGTGPYRPGCHHPDGTNGSFAAESRRAIVKHLAQPSNKECIPTSAFLPNTFCDSRLAALDITYWTSVPISDELAARLISLYLETDHALLGAFDPHLFISDLISHQHTYCSRLMVNSVMYLGCQTYMTEEERPDFLLPALSRESRENWLTERDKDSLLTLGGTIVLCTADIANGKNGIVLEYLSTAMHMGQRLGLFGSETRLHQGEITDPGALRAASFGAWGTFTWIVFNSFFYQQPGLQCPEFPPILPIPGEKAEHESGPWHPEPSPPPPYMKTFPILCQFAQIVHEISLRYHQIGVVLDQARPPLQFAEFKYRELLAWAETLPPWMSERPDASHHSMIFRMWYHSAILDIFRPFLRRQQHPSSSETLRTFSAPDSTPEEVFSASVDQLKSLVVTYRAHYAPAAYSILWHTGLLYLSNAMLSGPRGVEADPDPEWYAYFLVCIYGYGTLRYRFLLASVMARGLLSMALRLGRVASAEARKILEQFVDDDDGAIRAGFVGDLALAMHDPDAATVEYMAQQFGYIALLREFTNEEMDR